MSGSRALARAASIATAVVLLSIATTATSAQAIFDFSPPQTLSHPEEIATDQRLAIDSRDRVTVVWRDTSAENAVVRAVRIDPHGVPGPVYTLSEADRSSSEPRVAVDSQGRATVVWYSGPGEYVVQAVRIDADGVPGPVWTLAGGGVRSRPEVVVDSRDRATVVWAQEGGGLSPAVAMRLEPDGTPGPIQALSEPGESGFLPRAAVDSRDRVSVAWSADDSIKATRIGADGIKGPVVSLSEPGYSSSHQLAIDSRDRATVVWEQENALTSPSGDVEFARRIKAVRLSDEGTLGQVRSVSSGPGRGREPQLAIDSRDRVVVVWRDEPVNYLGNGGSAIEALHLRSRDGAPSGPETLVLSSPGAGDVTSPMVATDTRGRAVVVWDSFSLMEFPELPGFPLPIGGFQLAGLSSLGVQLPVQTLSDTGYGVSYSAPNLVIDSRDQVVVAWRRDEFQAHAVQMARQVGAVTRDGPPTPTDAPSPSPDRRELRFPDLPDEGGEEFLAIGARGVVVNGRVVLRGVCGPGRDCAGVLAVSTRGGLRRAQRRIIARGRYRLSAGRRGKIRVRLSKTGRRFVKTRAERVVGAEVRIRGLGGSVTRISLRLARASR